MERTPKSRNRVTGSTFPDPGTHFQTFITPSRSEAK
jgi:hypothetical protein